MKNKFLAVICIMLLFIPTVAAILVYSPVKADVMQTPDSIVSAQITDSQNNKYTVDGKEDIELIMTLLGGEKVDSTPAQLNEFDTLLVDLKTETRTDSFTVYASVEYPDDIYYQKSAGEDYYKAKGEVCREFLSNDYCVSLYSLTQPEFKIGRDGVSVLPYEANLQYQKANNKMGSVAVQTSEEIINVGSCPQDLAYIFTQAPDASRTYITIDDGESQLLSNFVMDSSESKEYTVTVEANWSENGILGSAKYRFLATIDGNPVFNIWTSTKEISNTLCVEQGGIIVIGAKNVNKDKIECLVSPSPMTQGSKPIFYENSAKEIYAIIPTTFDTTPGEYEITINYNNRPYTFEVEVEAKEFASKTYKTDKELAEKYFSKENLDAVEKMKQDIFAMESASEYMGDESIIYPNAVETYRTAYGITMNVSSIDYTFRHTGIDTRASSNGSDVFAVADGKIIYAGLSELYGGVIVIDHGMGVRSWYCRVDISDAVVGAEVSQGDIIAESDESGFGDDNRLHLSISIGNDFVSPQWLIENGIHFPALVTQ